MNKAIIKKEVKRNINDCVSSNNNTEGKIVSSVKGGDKFENTETIKDDDGREVTTKIDLYTAARIRPGEEFKQGKPSNETLFAVREPDVLSQLDTNSQYYNKILNFDSVQEMADSFAQEYKSMSDSIKKYHGFYIGRYELTRNMK